MRNTQHFTMALLSLFIAHGAAHADPGAALREGAITPERPVMFLPGAATLPSASLTAVESVAGYLAAHPEIGALRVEVHAGTPANEKAAVKLSTQRASAVVAALIKAGVDRKRVTAVGLGPRRPVAPWALPGAEAVNERVVFRITASDGKPVVFPVAMLHAGAGAAINADGTEWKEAPGRQPLFSGSVLGTREDGNAWVDVPGRAWLRLGAGVALRLEGDIGPDSSDKPLALQLGAGALTVDARPSGAPVQLQVGGKFVANIAGVAVHSLLRADGSAQVGHLGGAPLKFTAAGGKRVTLVAGQVLVMDAAGVVSAPTAIPSQPTWKDPPTEEIRALAVAGPAVLPPLSLNAVEGATGWRAFLVPYQGGTASQVDVSPALDVLALRAEGGRFALAVQALGTDGLPGVLSPWLPVTVRAAPFARAAMGPAGVIQVAAGQRVDWTGGLQCNGESFTDFKTPGEKVLTCTDDEGNVFAPMNVQTMGWRASVVDGKGDLTVGTQQDVTVEVSCDAPLPATMDGALAGGAKARRLRQQRPGGALAKVVAFHLDLDPLEAGTATFTATTGLLDAPPVSVSFNIVAPPPPPPPPPAPPVAVAPPPVKKAEPTGPQAWGWRCLVDPRSWCVPAGFSVLSLGAAVVAGVVGLGAVAAWAAATNQKMDLGFRNQTFLNVGTVAGAVGVLALVASGLAAATAVGNAGTALAQ